MQINGLHSWHQPCKPINQACRGVSCALNPNWRTPLINRSLLAAALAALVTAGSAVAAPVQLISNGDFETGLLGPWTVTDLAGGSGSWFVHSGATTPVSGNSTVGAAGGTFYAVTDQGGPGTHVLEQSFTVPFGALSVILSFDMFMNDQSGAGPIANPAGLDHTAGPNQHARVDVMSILAGAFSTSAIDIVSNVVPPSIDPGANPHSYTGYSFDITGLVTPGTSYKLRFGEVDNQFFFNQGVDNVSIVADVGQVPEPGSLALVALGLVGAAAAKRRQRR